AGLANPARGGAAQLLVHAYWSRGRSLLVADKCRPVLLRGGAHRVVGGKPVPLPAPRPLSDYIRSLLCPPISVLSPGSAPGAAHSSPNSWGGCCNGCLPPTGGRVCPLLVLPAGPYLPGQPRNAAGQAGESELSGGRSGHPLRPDGDLAALSSV